MLKPKKLTTAELWKARKDKEELENKCYLPPGLINHGNTCFMNSVLQGLIATRDLYNLVHFSPLSHIVLASSPRPIFPERSPQLTNGHGLGGPSDQEWTEGMPLGDVFIRIMYNAWSMQDLRRRDRLSPKQLLDCLGRKYDQYLDFRQQDAHEFLRLLLDAMRMEELDIIKKRQPPPPKEKKRKSRSSPQNIQIFAGLPDIDEADKLESFVDMLFGGKLASFLVCEQCKHVSRTYEDFNDLSLSIKPEDFVKDRKRNRLKSFAKKFGLRNAEQPPADPPRSSSVPPSPTVGSFDHALDGFSDPRRRSYELIPSDLDDIVAVGESESNVVPDGTADGKEQADTSVHVEFVQPDQIKRDLDKEDDNWLKLRRLKSVGMKGITRSKSRGRSSKSNTTDTPTTSSSPPLEPAVVSNGSSPGWHPSLPTTPKKGHKLLAPPPLSPEESAYLRHILADTAPTTPNPFAIFRPMNPPLTNGGFTSSQNHGLWTKMSSLPSIEECLRWFTSVEMLDGENMVGCRRCWKIANGLCKSANADQSGSEENGEPFSPSSFSDVHNNLSASPVNLGIESSPQSSRNGSPHSSPASTSVISLTTESSLLRSARASSAISLPTTIESSSPKHRALKPMAMDDDILVPSSSSIDRPSTYVGIPIPSISTTAPESPISPPVSSRTIVPNPVYPSASVSLRAPKESRRRPPHLNDDGDLYSPTDVSSDGFDETESDASLSDVSPFVSPPVSPNASQQQLQFFRPSGLSNGGSTSKHSSSKISRSKQIIMRRCYKRYLISEPPPVLVIHLKRFQQTSKNPLMSFSTGFKKLDDFVAFPEQLDLTPFLAPDKEDFGLPTKKGKKTERKSNKARCMYRLYAVVVHIGNMLGGHYIAYTALPSAGVGSATSGSPSEVSHRKNDSSTSHKHETTARRWAYISDTVVRLTTLDEVLKSKAYICMYERIS